MQFALVYGSIGALALLASGWRVALALRAPQAAARWAVAIAIACAALGFEAAVPQIYSWIGRTSGIPNLASLIVYSAIATAVLSQLVWTSYLVAPDSPGRYLGARTIVAVNVAVVAVMAILFAFAPVHDEIHATDFDDHYAKVPVVDVFLGIYLCAYTLALLRLILLCRAWLPQVRTQPWLRRGLLLLCLGSTVALGYSVGKTIAIAGAWAGFATHRLNIEIAPAFASLGAAAMTIGYLCPSLLPNALTAARRARALPRLRPLWSALCEAAPELSASAPPGGAAKDRVYRRVIEIRDALLILQPRLTPEMTTRAVEFADALRIPASRREAAIEAARIAQTLHVGRSAAVDHGESFHRPEIPSFQGELTWLLAVSRAYHSSPIVAAVLADLECAAPPVT